MSSHHNYRTQKWAFWSPKRGQQSEKWVTFEKPPQGIYSVNTPLSFLVKDTPPLIFEGDRRMLFLYIYLRIITNELF